MVTELPEIPDTGQYPIGKAAKLLGIDRRTLLRKTMSMQIKARYRRDTGRKFYMGSEIKRYFKSHL